MSFADELFWEVNVVSLRKTRFACHRVVSVSRQRDSAGRMLAQERFPLNNPVPLSTTGAEKRVPGPSLGPPAQLVTPRARLQKTGIHKTSGLGDFVMSGVERL